MINPLLRPSQARPKIEFFENSISEWHWQITHPIGVISGLSPRGFKTKKDCINNLRKILEGIHEVCEEQISSEP